MTPERWQQVKDALAAALARGPDARAVYLAGVRARDPDLCQEVETFLARDRGDSFLEHPAAPRQVTDGPGGNFIPALVTGRELAGLLLRTIGRATTLADACIGRDRRSGDQRACLVSDMVARRDPDLFYRPW